MIRLALAADYELVKGYTEKLREESIYGKFFKGQELTQEKYSEYITHPLERMLLIIQDEETDCGFVAFDSQTWPFLDKEIKFTRIPFVYIDPAHRKKGLMDVVIKAFEYWTKQVKASYCMLGTKTKKKRGYQKSEVVYIKEV